MTKLYYQALSDEIFNDMKKCAIETWTEVAHDPFYLKGKVEYVGRLTNVGDNFMTIFAMFDIHNQRICGAKLTRETRLALNERLIDGGNDYLI